MHEDEGLTARQIAADQALESVLSLKAALDYFEKLSELVKTSAPNAAHVQELVTQVKTALLRVDVSDRLAFVEHMMLHLYVLLTTLAIDLRRDLNIGSAPEPAQPKPTQAQPITPA